MARGMIEGKRRREGASRYLPSDVVAGILRRLPARSVARCRCVCKQWRSLTHDHRFIEEHRRLGASERCGLLASPEGLYRFGPDHDVVEGGSLHNPDGLIPGALSNPLNGLIAAFYLSPTPAEGYERDRTLHPYLINPITRDRLLVPGGSWPDNIGTWAHLGLGFDASRGTYKLVCLQSSVGTGRTGSCSVLTVGADGGWRRVQRCAHFEVVGYSPPVFLEGAVYWLASTADFRRSILAFDVEEEELRLVPMPSTQLECTAARFLYLLDLDGRLCLVECSLDTVPPSLRVWKLEGRPCQQHWRLDHNIDPPECLGRVGTCLPWVVDIRGGKEAILQMFDAIWSYDLHTKTLLKLSHCHIPVSHRLVVIAETLVSPTTLVQA